MATDKSNSIRVRGLKDLQRELRSVNTAWPRELRVANKQAAELVAKGTRDSMLSRTGVAPKVAPSVVARAQQRSASVKIGGAQYPFAMGSNFGSFKYKQFPIWAGKGQDYSLYKTLRSQRDDVIEVYGDLIDRLTRKAFPH